jgi:hypothetical protein
VEGSHERGNELSGAITFWQNLKRPNNCRFLKDSVPWSYFLWNRFEMLLAVFLSALFHDTFII